MMAAGGNTGMLEHAKGAGVADMCQGSAGPPKQATVVAWANELKAKASLLGPWLDNLSASIEMAIEVATAAKDHDRKFERSMAAVAKAMEAGKSAQFFASMIDLFSGIRGLTKGIAALLDAFKKSNISKAVGAGADATIGAMKTRKGLPSVSGPSVDAQLANAIQSVNQYATVVSTELKGTLGILAVSGQLNVVDDLSTIGVKIQNIALALEASAKCAPGSIYAYPANFVASMRQEVVGTGLAQEVSAAQARLERLETLAIAIAAGGGSALTPRSASRTLFDELASWHTQAPEKFRAVELTTFGEEIHLSLSTATVEREDYGSHRQVFAHEASVDLEPRVRLTGNEELLGELAKLVPAKTDLDEPGIELDAAQQAALGTLGLRERQGPAAAYINVDGHRVLTVHGAESLAQVLSSPAVKALCRSQLAHPTVAIDGELMEIGERERDYAPRVLTGEGLSAL